MTADNQALNRFLEEQKLLEREVNIGNNPLSEYESENSTVASTDYSQGQSQEDRNKCVNGKFDFSSKGQNTDFANTLISLIKELGFKYELIQSENDVTVRVQMPKGFEGQDPAKMDKATLKEAQEAAKQESSAIDTSEKDMLVPSMETPNLAQDVMGLIDNLADILGDKDKEESKQSEKTDQSDYRKNLLDKYVNSDNGRSR